MIPTAEEFLLQSISEEDTPKGNIRPNTTIRIMKEFTKLHVEAALKEALDNIPCLGSSTDIASWQEVEDAVLNAYPLENIK